MHGATKLELAWTAVPVIVLFLIAAFVFIELPGIKDIPDATAGAGAARDQGDRPPVLLAVRVSERRHRDRPHARAVGRARPARGERAGRRRHPLVVDPGARRQDRRDPRPDERDVVPGRQGGDVHGPVRRAVRARARADARVGRGHVSSRRSTHGSSSAAPSRTRAPASWARRSGTGVCAKCHGMNGEGGIGPRIAGSPDAERPRGAREPSSATAGARCPPSARAGRTSRSRRSPPT